MTKLVVNGPISMYYYSFNDNTNDYNLLLFGDNHIKITKCISKDTETIDIVHFIRELLKNDKIDFFFENPIKNYSGGSKTSDMSEFSGI